MGAPTEESVEKYLKGGRVAISEMRVHTPVII